MRPGYASPPVRQSQVSGLLADDRGLAAIRRTVHPAFHAAGNIAIVTTNKGRNGDRAG